METDEKYYLVYFNGKEVDITEYNEEDILRVINEESTNYFQFVNGLHELCLAEGNAVIIKGRMNKPKTAKYSLK